MNRQHLINVLTWIGSDPFVEEDYPDFVDNLVQGFSETDQGGSLTKEELEEVERFLDSMLDGDRIRVEYETPCGFGVSFYYYDYGWGREGLLKAAEDVVKYYEQEQEAAGAAKGKES